MQKKIQSIQASFKEELAKAGDLKELENIKIKYAGRKGILKELLQDLGKLPPEERPSTGKLINHLLTMVNILFWPQLWPFLFFIGAGCPVGYLPFNLDNLNSI